MQIPDNAIALFADLNEPQRRAVAHLDGPLLVLAGPGSGKTRVITRRAACLVRRGVEPRQILAITFTNKAADEMKRRILELGVGQGMWIHTFHALGVRLLREFGEAARVRPGFTIYDEDDRLKVVKEAVELAGYSETAIKPQAAQEQISRLKNRLEGPEEALAGANSSDAQMLAHVYAAYQELMQQRNAVDYDDLLMRVAQLLQADAELTARLNRRFRYVLIDEYQDTNHAQYLIARGLSRAHANLCVTGDPDQSIYAWRGADLNNILEFERDYPNAEIIKLEQNYRSTGRILAAADRLIGANQRRKAKALWTRNTAGAPVQAWSFGSGTDEAEKIAAKIAEQHAAGRPYSDFAILYRINALSRGFEDALRQRGIAYQIVRGVEFYNRKEIKDAVAYLRLLVNPQDDVALLRVINTPPRGIGKTTVERLVAAARHERRPLIDAVRAADHRRVRAFVGLLEELGAAAGAGPPVDELVSFVLAHSRLEEALRRELEAGGEDRLANVQELVSDAVRYVAEAEEASLEGFLHRVSLVNDQDAIRDGSGVVLLMTLHAAKGLEFPVVFLAGLEQGLLPHERALRDPEERGGGKQLEEERRLCFVGMTRARELLFVSHAAERLIRGQPTPRAASQFLAELHGDGVEWQGFDALRRMNEPPYLRDDRFISEEEFFAASDAPRLGRARHAAGRAASAPRGWDRASADDAPIVRRDDEAVIPKITPAATSPYAGWGEGTIVEHAQYGVGQIQWIRPGPGQTRAGVKFPGRGEKTFVLEFAPIRKLERKPR